MKKFFGKLPVMITFIVLAVIMTVAYIGLLVRPVAIGFTYKGEEDFFGTDKKQEVSMQFKNNEVVRTTIKGEKDEIVVDAWVYVDGNNVLPLGSFKKVVKADDASKAYLEAMVMTEAQYDEAIKEIEEAKKNQPELYEKEIKESSYKINAFKMTIGEGENAVTYTCTGSIVFAIVGGVLELVLLAGAGLAVFYKVKK